MFLMVWISAGLVCLIWGMHQERQQPEMVLMDRVNPNTASMGSLVRLEGIGPVKAWQIIQYRQADADEGQPVFACPQDLEAVPGIGPKTVEKITPYLEFESEPENMVQEP